MQQEETSHPVFANFHKTDIFQVAEMLSVSGVVIHLRKYLRKAIGRKTDYFTVWPLFRMFDVGSQLIDCRQHQRC